MLPQEIFEKSSKILDSGSYLTIGTASDATIVYSVLCSYYK